MKLSDMTTLQLKNTLVAITPHAHNILRDEEMKNLYNRKLTVKDVKSMSLSDVVDFGLDKIMGFVPMLLDTHWSDVAAILAAVNMVTVAEIESQNGLTTMKQIREAIKDKNLRDFFKSLQSEGETE